MNQSTNLFIEELANDLKPGRHWHPLARSAFWGSLFFLVTVVGMLAYQSFRPHFWDQIVEHSRFAIELVSAFLMCNFLIYSIFTFMVPGRTIPKALLVLTGLAVVAWGLSQIFAFESASPPSSIVGARSYCVEEVFIYGLVGIGILFYFVQKARFPFKVWQYFLMGFVSGFIPGAVMQVACLYIPKHGLLLHYAPALVTGLLAAAVMPLLKKLKRT